MRLIEQLVDAYADFPLGTTDAAVVAVAERLRVSEVATLAHRHFRVVSKIEHGEISGIDVVRAYVSAPGGTLDIVATVGDRSWKVA